MPEDKSNKYVHLLLPCVCYLVGELLLSERTIWKQKQDNIGTMWHIRDMLFKTHKTMSFIFSL